VLETDRPRGTPDTVRDAPRPDEAQVGVDRGAVLAAPRARHEYALAYRATVDAVYARAALPPDGRQGGDSQAADTAGAKRPDMAERYPRPAAPGTAPRSPPLSSRTAGPEGNGPP
jgi:hypothetical protein